jgi:hypothetical protein
MKKEKLKLNVEIINYINSIHPDATIPPELMLSLAENHKFGTIAQVEELIDAHKRKEKAWKDDRQNRARTMEIVKDYPRLRRALEFIAETDRFDIKEVQRFARETLAVNNL